MSKKKLVKNIGSMSAAVFISRIFGLLRDIMMTNFFGTTYVADAFRVAYQIPNFLRRLFGEGALSAAFIPVYNEIGIKKGREEQIKFAVNILSILTIFLLFLCILGIIFTPLIVKLIAPGFSVETKILVMKLTRLLFPYLFFIGLSSTLIAILNSHDKFFIPGLSSAFLNIAMIGSLGGFVLITNSASLEAKITILSVGVLIGGFLQTVINLPLLKKFGYSLKLNLSFKGEAIKSVWSRLIPGVVSIAIRQINLFADILLASLLASGSIAALDYGNRLMQLPMGIFGIAVGTAVLPLFSRCITEKKWSVLQDSLRFSIISLSFIMLPITAIIAGLGKDIIRILFLRGQFDIHSLEMTYSALLFYSLGIIFYSMNRLLIPVFYANKDTKTPLKITAFIVALNIILNLILMQFLQHAGLALSTSISAMVQFWILYKVLKKKIPNLSFPNVIKPIVKIAFISLIIFGVLLIANRYYIAMSFGSALIKVVIMGIFSLIILSAGSIVLKIEYSNQIRVKLWKILKRS